MMTADPPHNPMRIHPPSFALVISLICASADASARSLEIAAIDAEDGDTLILAIDGHEERLQLAHIDAPEDTENAKLQRDIERTGLAREVLIELGRVATSHLRELSADGAGPFALVYDPERRDRYGRLVGEISDAGGRSLGARMVGDGFAGVLPPRKSEPPRPAALIAAEADAIASARGLWGTYREAALAWKGSEKNDP